MHFAICPQDFARAVERDRAPSVVFLSSFHMNDRVEKLLQPVSPDQPCGPDLTNDPRLDRLETILRGKPEVEIGPMKRPAEPPDWGTLLKESGKFLEASKHLRVAVMFACSALKVEGLPGFRDGVQLVRGMIEHY